MALDLSEERERSERREKQTRWLVWTESAVILGLLVWVSIEYESNQYLQAWVGNNLGPLGFLFNGTLAGLYAGSWIGYAIAWYRDRRSKEKKILESISRKGP